MGLCFLLYKRRSWWHLPFIDILNAGPFSRLSAVWPITQIEQFCTKITVQPCRHPPSPTASSPCTASAPDTQTYPSAACARTQRLRVRRRISEFRSAGPRKKAGTHQSPGRRARTGPRWKLLAPSKILGRWRSRRRGGSLLAWGRREADARAVEEKGGQADGTLGQGAVGPACPCGEDEGEGWDQAGLHSCGQG